MGSRWVALVVEVEWHAGHRGFERPTAVREGQARLELTVESVSSVGPAVAGSRARWVFLARDSGGRRLRIQVDTQGRTKVEVEVPG
jgi:hypothetical protein